MTQSIIYYVLNIGIINKCKIFDIILNSDSLNGLGLHSRIYARPFD